MCVSIWKYKWNNFWSSAWNKLKFQGLLSKKMYCRLSEPAPRAPPSGPWSGKGPFPRTQTSLWVLMLWDHDIPFWKPIDKPNINFVTDFCFRRVCIFHQKMNVYLISTIFFVFFNIGLWGCCHKQFYGMPRWNKELWLVKRSHWLGTADQRSLILCSTTYIT